MSLEKPLWQNLEKALWQSLNNPNLLFCLQKGIKDQITKNNLTDTSAGSCYYIHPETGELVTVAAGEVLDHPVLGITSLPAYEQLCRDSEDPGEWVLAGATRAVTGETFGPFTEYEVIDTGSVSNRLSLWENIYSGNISGTLYFSIRYNIGTSGQIRITCYNSSKSHWTIYSGIPGSGSITYTDAGTLVIFSDKYDSKLDYYILKGSILFNELTDSLSIGISPNSTDNSSIKILGADVSEDRSILDFHVPSSGSNVTIASRAGTIKAAGLAENFPELFNALDSEFKMSGIWTPGVNYNDSGQSCILTCNELLPTSTMLGQRVTGYIFLKDGTNPIGIDVNYTANTEYPFEIIAGNNTALSADKMQLNVKVNGVWQTAMADYDSSFDPTTDMVFGLLNPNQTSIRDLKVEKLKQNQWRS